MCGRYFFELGDEPAFHKLKLKVAQSSLFEYASEEIFPTNHALILLPGKEDYSLNIMKWGIEGFHNNLLINARSETMSEKKMFRPLMQNRCLIPCNGFFEWVKLGNHKQKIWIHRTDMPVFYMAGIYNTNREFVILTGESQGEMAAIHSRSPIILKEENISQYLQEQFAFDVDNSNLCFDRLDTSNRNHEQLSLLGEDEKVSR